MRSATFFMNEAQWLIPHTFRILNYSLNFKSTSRRRQTDLSTFIFLDHNLYL